MSASARPRAGVMGAGMKPRIPERRPRIRLPVVDCSIELLATHLLSRRIGGAFNGRHSSLLVAGDVANALLS